MAWQEVVLALLARSRLLPGLVHQYFVRRLLGHSVGNAWRRLGADIAPSAHVGPGTDMRFPEHVRIGAGAGLQGRVYIDAWGEVEIGPNVLINDDVKLLTAGHDIDSPDFAEDIRPIRIGEYAWLPHNIVILPGVTIGRAAVVGTGSVVTRDVPERAVVAGNPARVVGERADVDFVYRSGG